MVSNMTKAFTAKGKRALGCRSGYAAGGTTDVFRTGPNEFSDRVGAGAGSTLMTPPMGGAYSSPAASSLGGTSPQLRGFLGTPDYGTGPKQTGFVWNDGTPRGGSTSDQGQRPVTQDPFAPAGVGRAPLMTMAEMARGASAQDVAPAGVGRAPLRTMAEQQMAQGVNPNGFYWAGGAGDPMAVRLPNMPHQRGYVDGGQVPSREDPAEALLRRIQQNYGVSASTPPLVAQPLTPQPSVQQPDRKQSAPQQRSLGDVVRQRAEELKRVANYADGGEVRQVEFQGPGGPREDKIPVRFAGADIRVSDGERGLILPAKTAANPHAVDAIEDIIEVTNDGRPPRRGLGDGGRYADGLDPRTAAGAYANGKWSPEATAFRAQRGLASQPGPQNISPELQFPTEGAQVRRGVLGKGVDALKGGAQAIGDRFVQMLGGTPGVPQEAPPVAKLSTPQTPITDRARSLGVALGKGEIPGVVRVDSQGNRHLTKGAGIGMGVGAGLQFGDHFDAFDNREGGLSHGERAQLFLRDLGVLAGSTIGAVGGGTLGSFVTPVVGTAAGAIGGGIAGGTLADRGMGKLRQGINWANEKLGGAPNYFEDSDEMIARDRADRKARDLETGIVQKAVQPVNSALGAILQSTGFIDTGGGSVKPGTSNYSNEGRGRGQQPEAVSTSDTSNYNNGGRGRQPEAENNPNASTNANANTSTGFLKVTGEGAPNMMSSDVKRHGLGFTMVPSNMSPNQYVGADGTPNQRWEKTAAYIDAIRRNEGNRIALAQIQNERAGRDPMASRVLGQQMLPPGEDAATDMSSLEAGRASVARNLTSPNSGTRSLAAHQQHVLDTMVAQQQAQAKLQREILNDQTTRGREGNDLVARQEEATRKRLASLFRKPDPEGKKESVADEDKISDYLSQASSTMRRAGEEAKGDERHLYYNNVTKKWRSPAELDDSAHDRLRRLYEIGERVKKMGGPWLWQGPLKTTDDLRDWEPTLLPDGDFEMKRLTAKQNGKPFIIPAKWLNYAEGPVGRYMPTWGKTETNRYTQNTQGVN